MKEIINIYGETFLVDDENKKLYDYDNDKKQITYNVEIIKNGKHTGCYTDYCEQGTVDDIEERLKKWNNILVLIYASSVNFNASKNDPNKEKWQKLVEYVKENQDKYFTKSGNFKSSKEINPKDLLI